MKLLFFCLMALTVWTQPAASQQAIDLPDGLSPSDVRAGVQRECNRSATSDACIKYSRLFYCRVEYKPQKCVAFKEKALISSPSSSVSKDDCPSSTTTHYSSSGHSMVNAPKPNSSKYAKQKKCGSSSVSSTNVNPNALKLCIPSISCTYNVSVATFKKTLQDAKCGCKLNLAQGNYPAFDFTKKCDASKPIVIQGQNGVRFGAITINGNGLRIKGGEARDQITISGDYNRVTRVLFSANGQVDFIEGAAHNRIDHNDFILPQKASGETNSAIAFYRPQAPEQMYNNNRIDSNYFTTNTPTPTNEVTGSALFTCMYGAATSYEMSSKYGSSKTIIENNLFENWGRKNVLENKCSDNIFRNNTLFNTGRVLQRQGGNNRYENNWFENLTTGLAVREHDNKIIGNRFKNASLTLYMGTREFKAAPPQKPSPYCFQKRSWMPAGYDSPQGAPAVRTVIDNNEGPLIMGDQEGDKCEVPVLNTRIISHKGPITRIKEKGTVWPTSTKATPPAQKLSRTQVGRGASEAGCN